MLNNLEKPPIEQIGYVAVLHDLLRFDWHENYGIVGVHRFIYTYGILVGCDSVGYVWRWCYKTRMEADTAYNDWLSGKTKEPEGYTRRLPEENFEERG